MYLIQSDNSYSSGLLEQPTSESTKHKTLKQCCFDVDYRPRRTAEQVV